MRGITRHGTWAATIVLALFGALVLIAGRPAHAGQNVFIEVTPNAAQAGTRVRLRGSCDDGNNRQAEVRSDAFGRVTLRPENGFLTGAVTIPPNKEPGDFPVDMRCQNGNTASTTLTVLNMAQPTKGPATGGGGTADRGVQLLALTGGAAVVAVLAGFGLFTVRRRRAGTGP